MNQLLGVFDLIIEFDGVDEAAILLVYLWNILTTIFILQMATILVVTKFSTIRNNIRSNYEHSCEKAAKFM